MAKPGGHGIGGALEAIDSLDAALNLKDRGKKFFAGIIGGGDHKPSDDGANAAIAAAVVGPMLRSYPGIREWLASKWLIGGNAPKMSKRVREMTFYLWFFNRWFSQCVEAGASEPKPADGETGRKAGFKVEKGAPINPNDRKTPFPPKGMQAAAIGHVCGPIHATLPSIAADLSVIEFIITGRDGRGFDFEAADAELDRRSIDTKESFGERLDRAFKPIEGPVLAYRQKLESKKLKYLPHIFGGVALAAFIWIIFILVQAP